VTVSAPLVQHYSSWKVRCGIADYAADVIGGLDSCGVRSAIMPVGLVENPNLSLHDMHREYDELASRTAKADLVHIQHEFSFFSRISTDHANLVFTDCLHRLIKTGKPIAITFHSPAFSMGYQPMPEERLGLKAQIRKSVKQAIYGTHDFLRSRKKPETIISLMQKHRDQIRVIVHTQKTRLQYAELGIPSEIISVLPMGFKPRSENIKVSRNEARRILGISEDRTLLSIFGFISRYKGPLTAARALKLLPADYSLALVGGLHPQTTEPILEDVLKLWKKQDPSRLFITGYVSSEQVDLWQSATDFCLAPYLEIGMSGSAAITWAISSGKPVIASKTTTFREIYDASSAMMMVTPDCPHELAWTIKNLAASPELASDLVQKARAYTEANGFDKIAAKMLELYRQFPSFPATATAPAKLKAA